jgi:hypothetical protein
LYPTRVIPSRDLKVRSIELCLVGDRWVSVRDRVEVSGVDGDYRLFDESALGAWTRVRVDVEIPVSREELEQVLHDGEDPMVASGGLVAARCAATRLRVDSRLEWSPAGGGAFGGSIELARADLRGVLELAPRLFRATKAGQRATRSDGERVATRRGDSLGFGDAVQLLVDDVIAHSTGALPVSWRDFRSEGDGWMSNHHDDLFYVDFDTSVPRVYLNRGHESLEVTLGASGKSSRTAPVRASLLAYISHATWVALFDASIADCEIDEDDADGGVKWPDDNVKRLVLERVLPLVAPEGDMDQRLRTVLAQHRDPTRSAGVTARVQSAVQRLIEVDRLVIDPLQRVVNGLAEEDAL